MDHHDSNYFTRSVEATKITIDNSWSFRTIELVSFLLDYGIFISHLSNYYLQDNGLDESSNKNLLKIIKKY
jgi:hypothetical protein